MRCEDAADREKHETRNAIREDFTIKRGSRLRLCAFNKQRPKDDFMEEVHECCAAEENHSDGEAENNSRHRQQLI